MWAGPKKGDKIGDTIGEEAGLDRASFSGLVRAVYGLCIKWNEFQNIQRWDPILWHLEHGCSVQFIKNSLTKWQQVWTLHWCSEIEKSIFYRTRKFELVVQSSPGSGLGKGSGVKKGLSGSAPILWWSSPPIFTIPRFTGDAGPAQWRVTIFQSHISRGFSSVVGRQLAGTQEPRPVDRSWIQYPQ